MLDGPTLGQPQPYLLTPKTAATAAPSLPGPMPALMGPNLRYALAM